MPRTLDRLGIDAAGKIGPLAPGFESSYAGRITEHV
jgi:hypothetical protein